MGIIVYHNQGRFQSMLDVAAQFLLIMTAPKQEHDQQIVIQFPDHVLTVCAKVDLD